MLQEMRKWTVSALGTALSSERMESETAKGKLFFNSVYPVSGWVNVLIA